VVFICNLKKAFKKDVETQILDKKIIEKIDDATRLST